MLSYDALLDAVENCAAFRRRRRLQPAGGPGDKLFPPTYPGEGNEPPRHVFERRRIALQTAVVTLAGLRRLRFGGDARRDRAARAYLAALGLVALAEQDRGGYALRSRCDLVCDGQAPLELVGFDGAAEIIELTLEGARKLHERAFDAAKGEGFTLDATPLRLTPQEKLARIVRASQDKALSDEGGDAAEG